jgi:hypothetical protein
MVSMIIIKPSPLTTIFRLLATPQNWLLFVFSVMFLSTAVNDPSKVNFSMISFIFVGLPCIYFAVFLICMYRMGWKSQVEINNSYMKYQYFSVYGLGKKREEVINLKEVKKIIRSGKIGPERVRRKEGLLTTHFFTFIFNNNTEKFIEFFSFDYKKMKEIKKEIEILFPQIIFEEGKYK